jgi:hypothetical protein
LDFGIELFWHQIKQQQPQRPDVLTDGLLLRNDINRFGMQRFKRGQIIRYSNWHRGSSWQSPPDGADLQIWRRFQPPLFPRYTGFLDNVQCAAGNALTHDQPRPITMPADYDWLA